MRRSDRRWLPAAAMLVMCAEFAVPRAQPYDSYLWPIFDSLKTYLHSKSMSYRCGFGVVPRFWTSRRTGGKGTPTAWNALPATPVASVRMMNCLSW